MPLGGAVCPCEVGGYLGTVKLCEEPRVKFTPQRCDFYTSRNGELFSSNCLGDGIERQVYSLYG